MLSDFLPYYTSCLLRVPSLESWSTRAEICVHPVRGCVPGAQTAPGVQRAVKDCLHSDWAALPQTRSMARDKFLQLTETQFPQLQKGRGTCFLVSLRRLKSRCESTRCGDGHKGGAESRLCSWRKTKFPPRPTRQFSRLRPKAGPYSVTGFITFTTCPSSRTPTPPLLLQSLTPLHAPFLTPEKGQAVPDFCGTLLYYGGFWAWVP